MAYIAGTLDEIGRLADGRYHYRPLRHHVGITSFGATAWVADEPGDPLVDDYDEDSQPTEELFVVVSGRALFRLDGETVDAPSGSFVSASPGTRRSAVAAEPATTVLAIDGMPGKAYDATGWELWAPLASLYDDGRHDELRPLLSEAVDANPQYPMLAYNLACSDSLSGRTADAVDHLRRAIEGNEEFRAHAREDSDFDAIRDEPAFHELVS